MQLSQMLAYCTSKPVCVCRYWWHMFISLPGVAIAHEVIKYAGYHICLLIVLLSLYVYVHVGTGDIC